MLKRTYELDMVPGGIPLSIHLSQYDSDVQLIFQLYASQGRRAATSPRKTKAAVQPGTINPEIYFSWIIFNHRQGTTQAAIQPQAKDPSDNAP